MYPLGWATERHLKCIRICDVELFIHDDLTIQQKVLTLPVVSLHF